MGTFYWSDRFGVGDETIDAQHCYLFTLANELLAARGRSALTEHAMKLFRYVREHFNYEELVMRRIGFPGRQEHVAMHDDLITQLNAVSDAIREERWSPQQLDRFMNDWLLRHIVQEDIKIGEYLRATPSA